MIQVSISSRTHHKQHGGTQKPRIWHLRNDLVRPCGGRSSLLISPDGNPIATTHLVDKVFRRYAVAVGLSPFAVVCEGHDDVERIKATTQKAQLVESRGSVLLGDAVPCFSLQSNA